MRPCRRDFRRRSDRRPAVSRTCTAVSCGCSMRSMRWHREWLSAERVAIRPDTVVRISSGGERLTFAGDAVFAVGFDHPDWHNGFEHDPEEAARVRVRLLTELAANGEMLVATHLPFPSVGRVAVDGNAFRWVPAFWDY